MANTAAWQDNLDASARRRRVSPSLLALGLGTAILAGLTFATAIVHPPYSADSWTYWDLAKSVFHDFYRIPVLRSYQTETPWSNAFPPLWPALNALVAAALGTGPVTLLLTNVAVLLLFTAASAAAARSVFGTALPGPFCVVLMLGDPTWLDELLAGRPIPLQMTFLAAIVASLAAPLAPPARYALTGLLCGLMLATKFDIVPLVAALGLYLLIMPDRRWLPLFALAAVLPPLPWAWFSLTHFGHPFASDGSPIAAITDPAAFTTDFRLAWRPTLRDDPAAWLEKLRLHAHQWYWSFRASWSWPEIAVIAAGALGCAIAMPRPLQRPGRNIVITAAIALGLAAMLASYVVTGFVDQRYYAPIRWFAGFVAVGALWRTLASRLAPDTADRTIATIGLALALLTAASLRPQSVGLRPAPDFEHPDAYPALLACLDQLPPTRLLFLDDDREAARFGALTGRPTGMVPANVARLNPAELQLFIDRYGFGAVTWKFDLGAGRARQIGVSPIEGCRRVARIAATRP